MPPTQCSRPTTNRGLLIARCNYCLILHYVSVHIDVSMCVFPRCSGALGWALTRRFTRHLASSRYDGVVVVVVVIKKPYAMSIDQTPFFLGESPVNPDVGYAVDAMLTSSLGDERCCSGHRVIYRKQKQHRLSDGFHIARRRLTLLPANVYVTNERANT